MKTTPIAVSSFIEAVRAQALPVIFNLAIVLKPYAAEHHGRGNVLGAEYHVEDGYFRDTSANIKIYPNAVDSVVLIETEATTVTEDTATEPVVRGTPVLFSGIDPLDPVSGAVQPMIPDSWRYGFVQTDHGLMFCHQDNGPFVAWAAVKDAVDKHLSGNVAETLEQDTVSVETEPEHKAEIDAPKDQPLPKATRDFVQKRKQRR